MTSERQGGSQNSRRRFLRSAALLSAACAGVVLGLDAAARAQPSSPASTLPNDPPAVAPGDPVKVKVVYFGMPLSVVGSREEDIVLTSPSYLRDLEARIVRDHPLLAPMIPTMLISVNGVLGEPSTQLEDGDEVDVVPATAGG